MSDLRELIESLSLHDGDLIFVDADAVHVESFAKAISLPAAPPTINVWVVPVHTGGKPVADCVFKMSRGELEALIKEK